LPTRSFTKTARSLLASSEIMNWINILYANRPQSMIISGLLKLRILKQIGEHLTAGEAGLLKNIKKNRDELKSLQRKHSNLIKRQLDYEAQALFSERKDVDDINIIVRIFEDRNPKELKILAQKVVEKFPNTVILFGARAEGKASLFFLRSGELAGDLGKLMQDACSVIDGRGGGRPQQAQGGGPATDKLGLALKCAYEEVVGGFK
jgi:alanyl-tRNA synthetase